MHKITNRTKAIQILTVIFVILLIGILIIANLGLGSAFFAFIDSIPGADKIGHFILTGLLSLFVNLSMGVKTTTLKSLTVLRGSFFISILVVAEEISQLFLIHRGFELLDLTFDAAGILVFGRLAQLLHGIIPRNTSTGEPVHPR